MYHIKCTFDCMLLYFPINIPKKPQKKQKQNKKKLRLTLKKNIAEENMSQVIRLKNIDKAKKYFVEET